MSDNNSPYSALISNISHRDRAKDVAHILRTLINQTNKLETRFGIKKMLAVKKLLFESLFNFKFLGTTMSHDELLIAL